MRVTSKNIMAFQKKEFPKKYAKYLKDVKEAFETKLYNDDLEVQSIIDSFFEKVNLYFEKERLKTKIKDKNNRVEQQGSKSKAKSVKKVVPEKEKELEVAIIDLTELKITQTPQTPTPKTAKPTIEGMGGLASPLEPQPSQPSQPVTTVKEVHAKPKKTVKQPKGVLNSQEIMQMDFDTLEFTGEWADFMQSPAKNMRIAIWGKPKNGKTAGATTFANYLTQFGNVLYNFADQGFNKSTKDLWELSGLSEKPNAYAVDTRDLDELEKLCASGDYDFVFIDMINTYIHRTGIKYYEFEDRFFKKYPDISFILIFEVTKSGDFKGDQGWTHLPDALVTVDSFVMENQGRYGVGHYIVWEEGLKKTNPKKYKEYLEEEIDYPDEVEI